MKRLVLFLVVAMSTVIWSCHDERNAKIEVWLTDAPAGFQEVNIDLQGVEVQTRESDDEKSWQALEVTPKVYNLLDWTNGKETFLGGVEMPAGRLSQIRLILGENNTVKRNETVHPLNTPSGQQSGLKVSINQVLAEGITYKITLDFEAGKSVVVTGNNSYSLKPVIRAMTEAQDGAIRGDIEPAGTVSVAVMSGEELVTTTSTDAAGEFLIQGLDAGTYNLVFDPNGNAPIVEKSGVEVRLGKVTDIGVIDIEQ
jgi:hypothetical protein